MNLLRSLLSAVRPFVGISLSFVMLLAGCASMGNTLAQDLAWEQWKKCDRFRGITLKEIRSDGQIWVWSEEGTGEVRLWRECIQQARAEQAARKPVAVAASPPPPQIAKEQPPVVSGPLLAPMWKVGDEWAYRWESPQGKGTFVWSVDREEILDGIVFYVVKAGQREMYWRKADFAFYVEKMSGVIEMRHVPFSLRYAWPLTIGKTWESRFTEEKPVDQQTNDVARSCEVEAEESVLVPAGTFRTLKIVCRNSVTGSVTSERWYSPEVKQSVRERTHFSYGVRERELIDFRLR